MEMPVQSSARMKDGRCTLIRCKLVGWLDRRVNAAFDHSDIICVTRSSRRKDAYGLQHGKKKKKPPANRFHWQYILLEPLSRGIALIAHIMADELIMPDCCNQQLLHCKRIAFACRTPASASQTPRRGTKRVKHAQCDKGKMRQVHG